MSESVQGSPVKVRLKQGVKIRLKQDRCGKGFISGLMIVLTAFFFAGLFFYSSSSSISRGTPLKIRDSFVWAPVVHNTVARKAPGFDQPQVASLFPRTPEGTANIVLVLTRSHVSDRIWVKVRLAVLPNNMIGWIPRSSLGGYREVSTRLVIDTKKFTATLYRSNRRVFQALVGVGKPQWPTPKGHFYIRNLLTGFQDPFYGPLAFGTSARSSTLTDWPAGGFVGIHGTSRPDLIPGRISHGCIRMRNADIIRLARLMPVGTPVNIK
jgi:lipoprotein-anchoring transpeptidase ErfK/SrfK